MFAGQVMTRRFTILDDPRKAHAAEFPLGSPAVQLTVFVPLTKVLRMAARHVTGTARNYP